MTSSNPVKPTIVRRIIWMWQDWGEWFLGIVVLALFTALGYGFAMSSIHHTLMQMQELTTAQTNQRVTGLEGEKTYLRAQIQKKNDDIRFLQGKLADQGQGAAGAAADTAKAVKNLSEQANPGDDKKSVIPQSDLYRITPDDKQ